MRRIRIAAYDGNRLAKAVIRGLHWSRQVWHVSFGHVGILNQGLPIVDKRQFVVALCSDVMIHAYWSTCNCGITQHVYQTMVVPGEILEN